MYNIVWDESIEVSPKADCKPQGLLVLMCQRSLPYFWSRFKEDMSVLVGQGQAVKTTCVYACMWVVETYFVVAYNHLI
jgi:hypothetical protein